MKKPLTEAQKFSRDAGKAFAWGWLALLGTAAAVLFMPQKYLIWIPIICVFLITVIAVDTLLRK